MKENNAYHDNHYAEMIVQPIEVMQTVLSPEGFNGYLFGNAAKYHLRAGHKAGENIAKENDKRDRYISWMYVASRGTTIDPKADYECPSWYKQDILNLIDKKAAEMEMARKYGEKV